MRMHYTRIWAQIACTTNQQFRYYICIYTYLLNVNNTKLFLLIVKNLFYYTLTNKIASNFFEQSQYIRFCGMRLGHVNFEAYIVQDPSSLMP